MTNTIVKSMLCSALLLVMAPSFASAQTVGMDALSANTVKMEKAIATLKERYAKDTKNPGAADNFVKSQEQWKKSSVESCKGSAPKDDQAKLTECVNAKVVARIQALEALIAQPVAK